MVVKRGRRHTDMGIGASISHHCMVLGAAPGFRCCSLQPGCLGHSWFLNTVVNSERERWKGSKEDIHCECWVGFVRVIPIFSADMNI